MRFSESEIVEDMLEHIRQAGGEFREWHVGTATNAVASGQLSVARKQAADGPLGGGQAETSLLRREAYTTFAARRWRSAWPASACNASAPQPPTPPPPSTTAQPSSSTAPAPPPEPGTAVLGLEVALSRVAQTQRSSAWSAVLSDA